jgi:hypothetical protein
VDVQAADVFAFERDDVVNMPSLEPRDGVNDVNRVVIGPFWGGFELLSAAKGYCGVGFVGVGFGPRATCGARYLRISFPPFTKVGPCFSGLSALRARP